MPDLSPECVSKQTSVNQSEFLGFTLIRLTPRLYETDSVGYAGCM
jgi:hypothetical protein